MRKKLILASVATIFLSACAMVGMGAAEYWDGKKFATLEGHWGEPTQKNVAEDGSFIAIFKAGDDCTATFNVNASGTIASHEFVGGSCSFDAYNRLLNIEH